MKRARRDTSGFNSFKSLFITDPDRAESDVVSMARLQTQATDRRLVEDILGRRVTTGDRIVELFSTHPNIVKRLKALRELAESA